MELQVLLWGDKALKNMQNGKAVERYKEKTILADVYKGKIPDVQLKQWKYPALGKFLAVIYKSNSGLQCSLFCKWWYRVNVTHETEVFGILCKNKTDYKILGFHFLKRVREEGKKWRRLERNV